MDSMRIDKWLWAARFFKTRTLAQDEVGLGRVLLNGQRMKPSRDVRIGDRLEIRRGDEIFKVTVEGLSGQRGPASEAQKLYRESEESRLSREQRKEILRLKEECATIILSTHDMGSVEELCDEIALVNHGKLVISGGVDDIRREYGNNNVELVYTDEEGRHTEVLPQETDGTSTLAVFLEKGVQINSYRELMPRMSDIFIKLVTEGEEKK